jgi:hypothetical protein
MAGPLVEFDRSVEIAACRASLTESGQRSKIIRVGRQSVAVILLGRGMIPDCLSTVVRAAVFIQRNTGEVTFLVSPVNCFPA